MGEEEEEEERKKKEKKFLIEEESTWMEVFLRASMVKSTESMARIQLEPDRATPLDGSGADRRS